MAANWKPVLMPLTPTEFLLPAVLPAMVAVVQKLWLGLNQLPTEGVIAAIGFYGNPITGSTWLIQPQQTVYGIRRLRNRTKPDLAILVSCIGNNPELRNRTEEEVHAVNEIFGTATCTTGFYSYGDISPFHTGGNGRQQNETMTITTFTEF